MFGVSAAVLCDDLVQHFFGDRFSDDLVRADKSFVVIETLIVISRDQDAVCIRILLFNDLDDLGTVAAGEHEIAEKDIDGLFCKELKSPLYGLFHGDDISVVTQCFF